MSSDHTYTDLPLPSEAEEFFDNSILTVSETARFLRISRKSAYKLIRDGVIPSFRVGGKCIRILHAQLADWLERESK